MTETTSGAGRIARARSRALELGEQYQARLDERRQAQPAVDVAVSAYEKDRACNGNLLAAAVAFRAFTLLLPVTLLVATIAGALVSARTVTAEGAVDQLGLKGAAFSTVRDAVSEAGKVWWITLVLAIVAAVAFGRPTLSALRKVHALAWGQPEPPKVSLVKGIATLLGIATALLVVSTLLQTIRDRPSSSAVGVVVLSMLVYFGAWLGASLLLPHDDAPWTALIPGALLFAIGTQAFQLAVALYLAPKLDSSRELYGPLGIAAVLLIALYLLARLVIAAAGLNATLWERHHSAERVDAS